MFTPSAVLSAPYTLSRADTDEVGFTVHSLMHGDLIDQGDADSRRNGLNLVGVSPFIQKIVIGVVIVGAVWFDRAKRKD